MHWRFYEHGMEFGWLFATIFGILAVLGIIHLVNLIGSAGRKRTYGESPLHILKRRYAKGELTKEEFERMRDELTRE